MFALIENGTVKQYPYSLFDIRQANPNTSFPPQVSDATMAEYGAQRVYFSTQPAFNELTQVLVEGTPVFSTQDKRWTQTWTVRQKTADELAAQNQAQLEQARISRQAAYTTEADPIFFKSQRGEATQAEWLAKIDEIRARYP